MATEDPRKLRVPGYFLLKKLGSGLQAKVYKAKLLQTPGGDVSNDEDDNDQVAVKIFRGRDSESLLQSELRFLTILQGHRNIVHLVESITAIPDLKAVVLELCDKDLCTLTSNRVFSEAEAADFLPDVLSASEHIHKLRVVHRDIKPDNIARGRDGSARLMDFGISAWAFDDVEMLRKCGSPGYMAPEMIDQEPYGPPVDIFAFGATMYFMLSNQHAFETECGTVESILAKTKFCVVSFGINFCQVGDNSRKLISWCMHEDAKWRPDASFALSCPPFTLDFSAEGEHRPMSFEEQLDAKIAGEIHPFPPDLPREGMKRPTPCLMKPGDGSNSDKPVSLSTPAPDVLDEEMGSSHVLVDSRMQLSTASEACSGHEVLESNHMSSMSSKVAEAVDESQRATLASQSQQVPKTELLLRSQVVRTRDTFEELPFLGNAAHDARGSAQNLE